MGPIQVVVQDGNNLVLEVTPTPNTTVIVDRGIAGPPGPGDVNGPALSTDNALARFDGTTGKLIQNSVGILSDAGALTGLTAVDTTALDATNINALDGTASFAIANTTGVMTINDTKFTLQDNADTTKKALFELSGITTATTRTYTLPNATGTLATLANTSQTFTGSTSFVPATNSGTITIGGIPQTGTITVDRSQVTHTLDVGVGPTLSGSTKTINFGTAGVSGSITSINIGSAVSGAITTTAVSGNFTVQGVTVGLGGGAISTNTAVGASALAANTTSGNNTAVGNLALLNSVGINNTAVGAEAMRSVTTGADNIAIGYASLFNGYTGSNNIAIGATSMYNSNVTGSNNIAVGKNSGLNIDAGSFNTFIGTYSGQNVTTGSKNVIVGCYTGVAAPISGTGSNWIVLSDGDGNVRQSFDPSGNSQMGSGAAVVYCPTPSTITGTATLTNANIQAQIINTTGAALYTVTLPLGTDLETLIPWSSVDLGYDFYVINSVPANITIAANTGVTIVGRNLVATNISAQFRIRRTAANTFIVYRIN
jgi:hypothetical protein